MALNIVAFPTRTLDLSILKEVLEGGNEKIREAGAFLLGGHSVEDREPKYGLVVYGEVGRDEIWQVTGARPGDLLLLTKPVGTGIAATAIKAGMLESDATKDEGIRWMTALNDLPPRMTEEERKTVHSCTDVTGFGLAGHSLDMLSAGGLDLRIGIRDIPLLPGVLDLADMGLVPEGAHNNRLEYGRRVRAGSGHDPVLLDMIYDAQTSGGLLLALEEKNALDLITRLKEWGFTRSAVIGRFLEGSGNLEIVDNV